MISVLYILHDTSSFSGASKAFLAILNGLKGKDVKPIVALPNKEGVYADLRTMNIETVIVPIRNATYPRIHELADIFLFPLRLIYWRWCNHVSVRRLTSVFKSRKPDLIHTNVSVVSIGLDVANKLHIPHVMHFREYGDKVGFRYYPTSACYHRKVKSLTSYSVSITKDIQAHHRLEDARNEVIYDGVFHKSKEMPKFNMGGYFLYAGRIEPTKGLLELLQAYSAYGKTVEKPYPLHVAGVVQDHSYMHKVQNFISKNSEIEPYIVFLGQCGNMNELYRNARALIVPSVFEGFGFCMPEAMNQGCLVIAHNNGGTKEQLENGKKLCGMDIALGYNSVEELTKHLCNVHRADNETYSAMKQAAFRTVNSLYTIETANVCLYNMYVKICSKKQ